MAGVTLPANIARAVLVGQMISPSAPMPVTKGVNLHTLWGHLAYQLGGLDGYQLVRTDDEMALTPWSAALKKLFQTYGPAIVLIDEWVAYARQLRDGGDGDRLAGGDFDTQFTFAQALTEAAAAVPDVVVLVSVPASDIEVGGDRGRDRPGEVEECGHAQSRRVAASIAGRIVRDCATASIRPDPDDKAKIRDGVIRAFAEMYRTQPATFHSGTSEAEYRRRMELSYPIHLSYSIVCSVSGRHSTSSNARVACSD